MFEFFLNYIAKYSTTPLTDDEVRMIEETFIRKKFRKRQYFLQEGEVCKYLAFIVKGAMRQYSVDEKGTEHIVYLSIENWWAGDRESYPEFLQRFPQHIIASYLGITKETLSRVRNRAQKANTISTGVSKRIT